MGRQEVEEIVKQVQEQLKHHNYLSNSSMREAFLHHDKDGSGFLDKAEFFALCDRFNVPVSDALVNKVRRRRGQRERSVAFSRNVDLGAM